MKLAYVQTASAVAIIEGDTMLMDFVEDTQMLFVYAGEKLTGIFRMSEIVDAHLTEKK